MRLLLPPVLTIREARDTQRMLSQSLRQDGAASAEAVVTVDASALQRFDSAALSVLLECQRMARANGRAFAVQHLPPKLTELARLYGVDGLLQSA